MKIFLPHFWLTASILYAPALAPASPGAHGAPFSIAHCVADGGGGKSSSPRLEAVSSLNGFGIVSDLNARIAAKTGFAAQLNEAPIAALDQFVVEPGRSLKILKARILSNDRDPEGGALKFVSMPPTSVRGTPLSILGGWILYEADAANTADDVFSYRVSDGIDEAVGAIHVTVQSFEGATLNISLIRQGADNRLRIHGIPGLKYQLQVSTDLLAPILWSDLGLPQTAPYTGLIEIVDVAPAATRFYRAIQR